jgi:hypothetical protein
MRLAAAASVIAVVAIAGNMSDPAGFGIFVSPANAEDGSGGPENSKGNQGGQGQGSQGAQAGQGNQGGKGSGQGGPDPDSDSKGPQAGGPADTGSSGGKPAWAQEGIPEVELGRLSVARSPDQVLDRAYAEALATIAADSSIADFYELTLDEMIEKFSLEWDEITIIDSPLQNLALMQDVLDGTNDTGLINDSNTLLAVFLGVASDKAVPISTETVIAVTTILGDPITGDEAAALAADAEAIRIAVLAGHG